MNRKHKYNDRCLPSEIKTSIKESRSLLQNGKFESCWWYWQVSEKCYIKNNKQQIYWENFFSQKPISCALFAINFLHFHYPLYSLKECVCDGFHKVSTDFKTFLQALFEFRCIANFIEHVSFPIKFDYSYTSFVWI